MKALLLLLPLLASCAVHRTTQHSFVVHTGRFEFQENPDYQETVLEYRTPHLTGVALRPAIGVSYVGKHGHHALTPFLAARYDLDIGAQWIAGPSFGLAYYHRETDDLPDLGSELLFRTAIDVTRSITPNLSIGFGWLHLSNGNLLGSSNPGGDSLVVTVEWKF